MNARFENFVGMVYSLNKEIQRIKSEKMTEFGLRGTDTMVIYYLAENPEGETRADLARLTRLDRAAITRIVGKLEADGLVREATGDNSVNYRRRVRLTEDGRRAAREMEEIIQSVVDEASADVGEEERARMYGTLEKILEALERV
ncbi:MAG: MarR family transcriptional regulator [Olsenella sp.]|jgi:DNA-binding MarR family transcriptional regulator